MARKLTTVFAAAAAVVGVAVTAPNASATPNAFAGKTPPLPAPLNAAADTSADIASDVRGQIDDSVAHAYDQLPPEVKGSIPAPRGTQPDKKQATPAPADCSNCVALTYDDGPGADTNRLLDTLRARHAHASFMVVGGNAGKDEGTLKRMRAEGHTVGNHTTTHPQLPNLDGAALGRELDQTSSTVEHATGQRPKWLRPPYGATNDAVNRAAGDRGMAVALWDVDTRDWATRDTQATCRTAVDEAQAGSIVLMHDIHASSVDAANCILDGLADKGLRAASLDEMIPNPQPGVTYTRK